MSEPEAPRGLLAFLAAKWKSADCPRCGVNDWAVGGGPAPVMLHPVGMGDYASIMQTSAVLKTYWMFCKNCGHLEQVAAAPVEKWIADASETEP